MPGSEVQTSLSNLERFVRKQPVRMTLRLNYEPRWRVDKPKVVGLNRRLRSERWVDPMAARSLVVPMAAGEVYALQVQRRRHKIPRAKYQVTNWPEYDAALVKRGSLPAPRTGPQSPYLHSRSRACARSGLMEKPMHIHARPIILAERQAPTGEIMSFILIVVVTRWLIARREPTLAELEQALTDWEQQHGSSNSPHIAIRKRNEGLE
jgi:hypothetical protein